MPASGNRPHCPADGSFEEDNFILLFFLFLDKTNIKSNQKKYKMNEAPNFKEFWSHCSIHERHCDMVPG
jgi:hypothetical protein